MLASKSYFGHLQAAGIWADQRWRKEVRNAAFTSKLGRGRCPSSLVTLSCAFTMCQHNKVLKSKCKKELFCFFHTPSSGPAANPKIRVEGRCVSGYEQSKQRCLWGEAIAEVHSSQMSKQRLAVELLARFDLTQGVNNFFLQF